MKSMILAACACGALATQLFGQTCFTKLPLAPTVNGFAAGELCDFDGDGLTDAALADFWPPDSALSIFCGAADGTFTLGAHLPLGAALREVRCTDADHDGDLDVLALDFDQLFTVLNDGGGALQVTESVHLPGAMAVVAADFELDGDPDAAVLVAGATGKVHDLRNNGSGAFTDVATYSALLGSADLMTADLDVDGAPDLSVTNTFSFGISVFMNEGAGTFAPGVGYGVAGQAAGISSADLDADGLPEILVASLASDLFNVLKNTGQGHFAPAVTLYAGPKPGPATAGDFDCDGDQDLFLPTLDGALTLLENDGGGALTAFVQSVSTPNSTPLGASDLNGDQQTDLVLASFGQAPAAGIRGLWNHTCFSALAGFSAYGGGINPAGSMGVLAGEPRVGSTLILSLENPLGTQSGATQAYLQLASAPDPAFPGGTLVPGFGMAGGGAAGELLIGKPFGGPILGYHWTASPEFAVKLAIPSDCQLVGGQVYAQGLLIDPLPASPATFGLTEGAHLTLGGP